jgi:hypothetical protein
MLFLRISLTKSVLFHRIDLFAKNLRSLDHRQREQLNQTDQSAEAEEGSAALWEAFSKHLTCVVQHQLAEQLRNFSPFHPSSPFLLASNAFFGG